jgi:hypothetical protein
MTHRFKEQSVDRLALKALGINEPPQAGIGYPCANGMGQSRIPSDQGEK